MTIRIRTSFWRNASASPERPILAIGDVHGRLDLLCAIHQHLEEKALPEAQTHGTLLVAHLGDYIDRVSKSLGCLLSADAFASEGCETLLLPSNHELRHCPLGGSPYALDRSGCDGLRQPVAKFPGLKAVVPSPSRQKVLHVHRD